MKLTINHNGFHGRTVAAIRVAGRPGDTVSLTPSQIARLIPMACGMSDCRCGESMLTACNPSHSDFGPRNITIPEAGEIDVRGNYPQR